MARRNYLVEGGSGTGKTTVCGELQRRGHHAINGDRELAYQGDPETGEPVSGVTGVAVHRHHLWSVPEVKVLITDHGEDVAFFCGGSRNYREFIDLFDGLFVLEADLATVTSRIDQRRRDEWGGAPAERELILELHRTREEIPPNGIAIDATAPVTQVVDEILRVVEEQNRSGSVNVSRGTYPL